MSQKFITLPISEELYERVQAVAEASHRSPEDILRDSIEDFFRVGRDLPPLEALDDYSNMQLWRVVLNDLLPSESERLHELIEKNKWGELIQPEAEELETLVALTNRYMLYRSQALLLLQQRGENIGLYLKLGA